MKVYLHKVDELQSLDGSGLAEADFLILSFVPVRDFVVTLRLRIVLATVRGTEFFSRGHVRSNGNAMACTRSLVIYSWNLEVKTRMTHGHEI